MSTKIKFVVENAKNKKMNEQIDVWKWIEQIKKNIQKWLNWFVVGVVCYFNFPFVKVAKRWGHSFQPVNMKVILLYEVLLIESFSKVLRYVK